MRKSFSERRNFAGLTALFTITLSSTIGDSYSAPVPRVQRQRQAAAAADSASAVAQSPAIAIRGVIIKCHDGDTITARFTLEADVRLPKCWAPELDEPLGPQSRDHLKALCLGKRALFTVSLDKAKRLGDLFTFGRLVADVRVENDAKTLSARQVEAGLASAVKGGALGK